MRKAIRIFSLTILGLLILTIVVSQWREFDFCFPRGFVIFCRSGPMFGIWDKTDWSFYAPPAVSADLDWYWWPSHLRLGDISAERIPWLWIAPLSCFPSSGSFG